MDGLQASTRPVASSPSSRRVIKTITVSPSKAFTPTLRSNFVGMTGEIVKANVRGTRITVSTAPKEALQASVPKVRTVLQYHF